MSDGNKIFLWIVKSSQQKLVIYYLLLLRNGQNIQRLVFVGALKTGWKLKTAATLLQQFYSGLALNLVTVSHFLD